MKRLCFLCLGALLIDVLAAAHAAPQIVTSQGEEGDLAVLYSTTDLIQGLIPETLEGDRGWHPVNTDPADQLPAFTDGQGMRPTGLTGLLADFPPSGSPTKRVLYSLSAPVDISEIRVFSGNNGRDGRVFHTYTVSFSSDGGQTFTDPIYVQSHRSGTLNNAGHNQWYVVLTQLSSDTAMLGAAVNQIQFDFYGVHNSQGEMRDPFDGVNPFTGTDDLYNAPNTSPLIWEIDVLGQFSPPILSASCSQTNIVLSWTTGQTNSFLIQSSTSLETNSWTALDPQPPIQTNGINYTVNLSMPDQARFFRLLQQ